MCKIGELVLAYDTLASNDTRRPRAFYALYVEPNENGTGHRVIKLQTKRLVTTPKCIAEPMTQDIIDIVNKIGEREGAPDGIQFVNVDGKVTLEDLYPAEEHEDDSCVPDEDYENESDEDDKLSEDESMGDKIQLLEENLNDESYETDSDDDHGILDDDEIDIQENDHGDDGEVEPEDIINNDTVMMTPI